MAEGDNGNGAPPESSGKSDNGDGAPPESSGKSENGDGAPPESSGKSDNGDGAPPESSGKNDNGDGAPLECSDKDDNGDESPPELSGKSDNGDGTPPERSGLDKSVTDEPKKDKVVDIVDVDSEDTVEEDRDDANMALRDKEERAREEELERINEASRWWRDVTQLCEPLESDNSDEAYQSEDDLHSLDSDEEFPNKTRQEFTPRTDWTDFKFSIGLEFPTVDLLRQALKEFFIVSDRDFRYMFNNREKLKAVCKFPGCGWCLYAKCQRRDNMSFRVTRLVDEHDCPRLFSSKVEARRLANHLLDC